MPATECYLENKENGAVIDLADQIEVIIGRSPQTKVADSFVSKKQVSCCANYETYEVAVKWIGSNMSGINGYALKKGNVYKLTHGDRIELLLQKFIFRLVFKPPPTNEFEDPIPDPVPLKNDTPTTSKKGKNKTASIFEMGKPKKVCEEFTWDRLYDGQLYGFSCRGVSNSEKVASFDLDGTIITTKSGLVFPKDIHDWKFLYPDIPEKLQKYHTEGYHIVIFTNQAGISRGKLKFPDFRTKFEKIVDRLSLPIRAYVSTGRGLYRKPITGMWTEFLKSNGDVNLSESFYCGDAAGRPAGSKTKKDFSMSDRLFAKNINLPFFTPEELFLKQKPATFTKPEFDPTELKFKEISDEELIANSCELLLLVGLPASGKSFICQEYLIPDGYKWINRDTLNTAAKCLSEAESGLRNGDRVVVDNTNLDVKSREVYVKLAKKFKVPVRCGIMNVTTKQCEHNNIFRELTDTTHAVIAPQVMNSLKSKYEEPTKKEGFDSIFKINCIPKFKDDKLRELYYMHLLEK